MSNRTTLATFALQHGADDGSGLVDSPVTVVATDEGPGTTATFTVERHGEVMTVSAPALGDGPEAAEFATAADAMAFALDAAGWLHAVGGRS